MQKQFTQATWNPDVEADCQRLIEFALSEDFGQGFDMTSNTIVPETSYGAAAIIARESGIVCGVKVAELILKIARADLHLEVLKQDGSPIVAGETALKLRGKVRDLLGLERTILNFFGRLSGIASHTQRFVNAVAATQADICDTRKTMPGWRRLEKYAVRCGGGVNHRMGLYDAVLIKDNHIAFYKQAHPESELVDLSDIVAISKGNLVERLGQSLAEKVIFEVEVDNLEQYRKLLPTGPDIILLDNMSLSDMKAAVEMRNDIAPGVSLEASGGINLQTVAAIAATGVDRISVGALTHSSKNFDFGLDWLI
jgi:nicotinate-nucleotide pyrophosphorylase (carboxylating)